MEPRDSTGRRIARAREACGISQGELAERIGQTQQSLSAIENNDGYQRPRKLREIARILGVSEAYLLMETDDPGSRVSRSEPVVVPFDDEGHVTMPGGANKGVVDGTAYASRIPGAVPQIDAEAGAGLGTVGEVITIDSGGIQSGHAVTAEWVIPRQYLGVSPSRVILLPVIGTSMLPMLNAGDIVAVDTQSRVVRAGEIYVLDEGDGPIVKRLRLDKDSDPVMMVISSDNPAAGEYRRPADLIRVLGRVVARWSKM